MYINNNKHDSYANKYLLMDDENWDNNYEVLFNGFANVDLFCLDTLISLNFR